MFSSAESGWWKIDKQTILELNIREGGNVKAIVLSDDQIKLRISFLSTAVNQTRSYDNQCGRGLVNPKVYKKHARNSTKKQLVLHIWQGLQTGEVRDILYLGSWNFYTSLDLSWSGLCIWVVSCTSEKGVTSMSKYYFLNLSVKIKQLF